MEESRTTIIRAEPVQADAALPLCGGVAQQPGGQRVPRLMERDGDQGHQCPDEIIHSLCGHSFLPQLDFTLLYYFFAFGARVWPCKKKVAEKSNLLLLFLRISGKIVKLIILNSILHCRRCKYHG